MANAMNGAKASKIPVPRSQRNEALAPRCLSTLSLSRVDRKNGADIALQRAGAGPKIAHGLTFMPCWRWALMGDTVRFKPKQGRMPSHQQPLEVVRRTYAKQMLARAHVAGDARLENAFAAIPREAFLGPSPWLVTRGVGYRRVPAEPALIYQDVLVALKADKSINNGSPSLHAHWLHAARVKAGERVAHIGAGGGYYTAILSRLVGARGRVTAVEFDPDLAEAARAHLAQYRNVTVVHGDGAGWPREPTDLVYVNFAVDRPAPPWLETLKPGGRLIFPLGTIWRAGGPSYGVGLRVERIGDDGVYAARALGGAYFVRAEGDARLLAEGEEREALLSAFERGGFDAVKSLRWRVAPSPNHALLVGDGWSLGADAAGLE